MAKEHALTSAQQSIIRTLSAERTRAILVHDQAIVELLDMLTEIMGLEGDWTFGGTMDTIKLVRQEEPPKELSE